MKGVTAKYAEPAKMEAELKRRLAAKQRPEKREQR
jgi:hypothetical protein